jgi:uncharacterized membrane protein YhaH (DUF805 family)
MHKEHKELPDRGLLNLISQKLESGNDPAHIEDMLLRAGLDRHIVHEAIGHAVRHDTLGHQRRVEQNDFLPPLRKDYRDTGAASIAGSIARVIGDQIEHRGLFSGRLRRKDFVIGILFFFGFGFILANIALSWTQFFAPEFAHSVAKFILADEYGIWLMFIPFIFAPITIMVLSLMTRRLHNLGFPGWVSLFYLVAFISPFGALGGYLLLGFHVMLLILFIVMMTVKGHPSPNRHGVLPPSTGSIFKRVLGE